MLSRGALGLASPRVRRGLALSWSALFVLSLLLQYMAFAAAPAALAAHDEGLFELDGNALDSAAKEPDDDWNSVDHSVAHIFVGADKEEASVDNTYFTTGGSKDENDIPSWAITGNPVPDKDELTDAYGAIYQKSAETWFYFGADRFDNDGDAQIGFWFFQGKVGIANGDFTGTHKNGDVLILSEYTNGGVIDLVCAYEWDGAGGGSNIAAKGNCDPATSGSHLNLVAAGAQCDVGEGTFDICAVTNAATATAPWTFENKDGETDFATGQFFEGGINLSAMFGGDPPCFSSFLAETRSSQETDAQLKDFALGSLSTCVPPTIATQVRQDGQSLGSVGTINMGESVTDHATFSGSHGAVEGTAAFHVCFNASSTPNCATGGTAAGSGPISGGAADSDEFTPTQVGFYCFRVDYTPTADSEYLAGSHTNQTTECFQVLPANVTIVKTADDGSVNAGEAIGFTLSWGNTGAGKATGVVVSDNLPAGDDLDWSIAGSTGSGDTCEISGAVGAQVLTCDVGSINGNTAVSGTVHIVSDTTAADCGTITNKGSIDSGNDGSGDSSDSVEVLCPDILVEKSAAQTQIRVGDTASFTIKVTNIGDGVAKNVVLTDPLPGGLAWTIDPPVSGCSIASGTLTCKLGDMDPDDSVSITVTASTDGLEVAGGNCANLPNTASAVADNEGSDVLVNNSASADIDVCESALTIVKSVTDVNDGAPVNDPDLGVPGTDIGDIVTFTLHYTGGGLLENAFIVDVLPVGEEYVAGTASSNADFAFTSATFNSGTHQWTIRWDATGTLPDPVDGTVTYDVKVLAAAAEQPQPLVNEATIDSDQTNPVRSTARIAVAPPPEELTPPPTDVFTPATGTSNPGFALMLILLGVAAATIAIGFVTPVPARARRRDR
jgi:uncharacterized repeat protein (TIGR01451 family)